MTVLEHDHLKSKYDTQKYPVLTKEQFLLANELAIANDLNKAFEPEPLIERLESMPEGTKYPVVFSFIHEHSNAELVDPHMRCEIVLGPDGSKGWIDIHMDLFITLDSVEPVLH
jgi:hypothetical protein